VLAPLLLFLKVTILEFVRSLDRRPFVFGLLANLSEAGLFGALSGFSDPHASQQR
jgi:hypothetical protein